MDRQEAEHVDASPSEGSLATGSEARVDVAHVLCDYACHGHPTHPSASCASAGLSNEKSCWAPSNRHSDD